MWICCCLYKLAQSENFFAWNEKFVIGRSTVSLVIREVVHAIRTTYNNVVCWPCGVEMRQTMMDFKSWCGMLSVQGALHFTHILISIPAAFLGDYWYFKTRAYLMVAQEDVNIKKLFRSIYVRLLGFVNDQRIL